jgi:hypothetical protein
MFYRLSHIDGAPLPCQVSIDRTSYIVARGGLLLEPPQAHAEHSSAADGSSSLQLFGMRAPVEVPAFLASSSEPYRWISDKEFSISRRDSDRGAQFLGVVADLVLELRAAVGTRFLAIGTSLRFSAAPDDPISDEWSATFNYGPAVIHPPEPSRANDPTVLAAIQEFILAGEPERRRAARARLEYAWHASA